MRCEAHARSDVLCASASLPCKFHNTLISLMDLERWIIFLKISYVSQKNESRLVGKKKFITSVFFSDKLIFFNSEHIDSSTGVIWIVFILFILFYCFMVFEVSTLRDHPLPLYGLRWRISSKDLDAEKKK